MTTQLEGLGLFLDQQGFQREEHSKKFLGSEKHLDWVKIDFNAAEVITVQDYNNTKKT